jgi:hypothetical protein
MFGSREWVAQDPEEAFAHGEVETDHQFRGCPTTFTQVRPPRTTHIGTLNVVVRGTSAWSTELEVPSGPLRPTGWWIPSRVMSASPFRGPA